MRIAHLSDIHFCEKHLAEVSRVADFAADDMRFKDIDLIVLSGDLFDHRLEQNSPAMLKAVDWVQQLAHAAPVLILQGTFSHDAPRALDVFRYVRGTHRIHVADRIGQVVLDREGHFNVGATALRRDRALISCLPAVNKGAVAAAVGAEQAGQAVGEMVATVLKSWAPTHEQARALGVPTIVVSHGTVSGCLTEHGVPMAGLDHEYGTGSLFAAGADAVMLGHIHKYQAWQQGRQIIAYAGSLGRLHFGEIDPKGYLIWEITDARVQLGFVETPAKRLVDIEFKGAPNMEELAAHARDLDGAHVRIRYAIDEEHRASVDKRAILEMFAGAADVKIEARINPIQRQRTAGIVQATSVAERLAAWCEYTNTDATPLLERLAQLEAENVDDITKEIAA